MVQSSPGSGRIRYGTGSSRQRHNGSGGQPVVGVEGEDVDAVAGEIAVGIVAQRGAAHGAVLVEGVRRVGGAGG